jgi:uncharacterized NAD(P)/FAD-binding protein YdhS
MPVPCPVKKACRYNQSLAPARHARDNAAANQHNGAMVYRIVIIGAGFSGTVLAANLLRQSSEGHLAITLVERGPVIGRGVAYAARDWPYLLNVPAGRLSAVSSEPRQFLEYARRKLPDVDAEHYLPRELYGDYLQDFLLRAEREAPANVRLCRILDEVMRLTPRVGSAPFHVHLAHHERIEADCVVLALGTPPPQALPWLAGVQNHPAYHPTPWSIPKHLGAEHVVMILGNGLTMADAVVSLCDDPVRIPRLVSVSRRGLLPLPQAVFAPAAVKSLDTSRLARAASARELLTASRVLANECAQSGGDWREVVTSIRHLAPHLWANLSSLERRRFLRHLQSYWDVHRHRLPPQMWSRVESLQRSGRLEVNAGRIVGAQVEGDRLRMVWRPRGGDRLRSVVADVVVNALGPDYAVRRSRDPLLRSLLLDGLVHDDDAQLGIRTSPDGHCLGAQGSCGDGLYYLGPMLRADHWEATAATELRDHAERLARRLALNAAAASGA